MKRYALFIFLLLLIIISSGLLLSRQTSENSSSIVTSSPTPIINVNPNDPPKEMTFTGDYVCLPHKDTSGPQTMECAFGMKLYDGSYIAIDLSGVSGDTNYPMQSKLKVTGLYVPIEQISSNTWQVYPIKGIMKVTKVEKV